MPLKPSRLRRLNQRLTLAKYKIKSSTSRTLGSLVVVFITKRKLKKSILITKMLLTNQTRRYSYFSKASAPDSRLLNYFTQLLTYYGILNFIQLLLILFLFRNLFNAIVQSYSNNKY